MPACTGRSEPCLGPWIAGLRGRTRRETVVKLEAAVRANCRNSHGQHGGIVIVDDVRRRSACARRG